MSLCHSVSKKHSAIICLYVILSLKNTLFLLVPMLFCLLKKLYHYMSLCHFVSKKNSVITRPYVILSLKKHSVFTRPYVILSPKYPD